MVHHIVLAFLVMLVSSSNGSSLQYGSQSVFSIEQDAASLACDVSGASDRFDCHPDPLPSQDACEKRSCCWRPSSLHGAGGVKAAADIDVPYCYFPSNYLGYSIADIKETQYGYTALLVRQNRSNWPNDVMTLQMDVYFETSKRLHFKIFDPKNARYEVPISTPKISTKAATTDYNVTFNQMPYGITVTRASNGIKLFDSNMAGAPLIFADQFLQISTALSSHMLYGLGENKAPLQKGGGWTQYSMWNRDQPPAFGNNLYGTHPFFVNLEASGEAHGVFLLNSNAMDVAISPKPAVTFRTIGGILDFYVFTGPTPDDVISQYTDVIGKPFLPPYWSLGFHLCRYGYKNTAELKDVIARNRAINIPYEVQWTDIDYMDSKLDWTYDEQNFAGLPDVVADLHNNNQKYIMIIDPGISNSRPGRYPPYDDGLRDGIFINNATGQPLVGAVWPGSTVYPDFTNPKSFDWWYQQAYSWYQKVPYDSIWIDMNEPSNFVFGSTMGCPGTELDNPPYVPGITGSKLPDKTICPSAKQSLSSHYNLHNLYGLTETMATHSALVKIKGQRSIVISRSTYPSQGVYGGHWSGDISSTWEDLHYSIPVMLEFGMYGIPFVGADICGFAGDTTEELCIRWMQLGSFYPFMRNHNALKSKVSLTVLLEFGMYGIPFMGADICGFSLDTTEELCIRWMQLGAFYTFCRNHNDRYAKDQDPAVFSTEAQQIMKSVLGLRYTLLPYLYTQLFNSHITGRPVARPLSFSFPWDNMTHSIDTQFMWGEQLMISPVLTEGAVSVKAYFPAGVWYDIQDGHKKGSTGFYVNIDAPLETIPVHVRGGSIIPVQEPAINTVLARRNPFALLVALDEKGKAIGSLTWDDGESLDSFTSKKFSHITFSCAEGHMNSTIEAKGYVPDQGMPLVTLRVFGVGTQPDKVMINEESVQFQYQPHLLTLLVEGFTADLLSPLSASWQ